jgi:hypothetical protein
MMTHNHVDVLLDKSKRKLIILEEQAGIQGK